MRILFIFLFSIGMMQESLEAKLEKMIWKNRVVVLYCPSVSDTDFKRQKKWLSEIGKDFLERDLKLIECVETDLSKEDALFLQTRFKYKPNQFCFWLIGKDGEVKLVSEKPIKPEYLFGVIDAMPMRRNERKKS